MKLRFALLSVASLSACSTSSSDPAPGKPAPTACAAGLPSSISVSEGGRVAIPLTRKDLAFVGNGVTVTSDETNVTVRVPYAKDVAGALTMDVSCEGGTTQSIPIELRRLAWSKLAAWDDTSGAPAREYAAWWLDTSGTGALVVYGGFHYEPKQFTPANDAWRFDFASSAWSKLEGDLPTLPGGRAAPIPNARAVYFFGGSSQGTDGSIQTPPSLYRFEYDATRVNATKVTNLGNVGGSYTGSFVYDSKRSRWLSVCGVDSTMGLNCLVDAYTPERGFENVRTAGPTPDGRYGFHYAYDAETDRVIVFAGQNGSENAAIVGDTWALELASDPPKWVKLFADGQGPTKRRNGAFALDVAGHRLFVWGGTPDGKKSVKGLQVLTLDRGAEAWTNLDVNDVPSRTSALGAYDEARQRIVFGFGNDAAIYQDLWALDVANVNPR